MRSEKVKYQICSIRRKFGEFSEGIFIFVQGQSTQTGVFELALRDRNMQVRFI